MAILVLVKAQIAKASFLQNPIGGLTAPLESPSCFATGISSAPSFSKSCIHPCQHPSDDICRACPCSSWTIPADIAVQNWVKNCTARFYNHSIGIRNCLLKDFKIQSTETSFCICLRSNNRVLSKFYYLLMFFPCFNEMK